MESQRPGLRARLLHLAIAAIAFSQLAGCNLDSWFNPSVSGYWEYTPATIPILERIDVIEENEDYWGQTTDVSPEDLIPSDLAYRTVPGDFVTVTIVDLYGPGQTSVTTRRIDPAGFLRVPELGNVQAAGLAPEEIQEAIMVILERDFIARPQVDVVVEEGRAFTYTVYGSVTGQGLYPLVNPDLRLIDALAIAGGVSPVIESIYIIRRVELSEEVKPAFERRSPPSSIAPPPSGDEPIDIEDLIDELDRDPTGGVSPGAFAQDTDPPVDIDDLEPVRIGDEPEVDIDDLRSRRAESGAWIYVEERAEWVRVPTTGDPGKAGVPGGPGEPPLYVERVIEISNTRLIRGDSKYNIVVRPHDLIYVEAPPVGTIYVEGQINRPGTYNLPPQGITLSRLVSAAGGFGQLAIPERVDLIRKVGKNRDAAVRVNLGAIRQRTEPDILLKPDDQIIVGTNFWATPLAVIRNGFRTTYGFGFLLDRNFGNDVFGPPPTNQRF